jgi:hypothetical protein
MGWFRGQFSGEAAEVRRERKRQARAAFAEMPWLVRATLGVVIMPVLQFRYWRQHKQSGARY